MKAIIPVAGAGTKLRPHTYTQPKALIPIAGNTILGIIIDQLKDAGITDFIFIVGYLGEKIIDYVKHNYPDLNTYFVYQNERLGSGHAITLTREIVGEDEIIITLGDTICEYDIKEVLESPHNMLGIKKVDNPTNFGVAKLDDLGFVEHVYEKPAIPMSNIALVGLYKIKDSELFYECLEEKLIAAKKLGTEVSLTEGIESLIAKGRKVFTFKVKNWYDCGKKETLLESNAILLKKFGSFVHDTLVWKDSIIIPPVSIGPNCTLKNSIVGPHVAIGANSNIEYSVIKECIIGSFTHLHEVVLDNSIIGSDAVVKGLSRSLNIGDNTEIDFG